MENFNAIKFEPHRTGPGFQGVIFYPNGYGASVVRFKIAALGRDFGYGSHTYDETEWELAVLKGSLDEGWELTYDTPITHDVIGHLSAQEVDEVLQQIQELPKI